MICPGSKVRNRAPIRLKSRMNSDWEPFHQNGTMRNIFTNEIRHRSAIHGLVVEGESFSPGSIEGVVGECDELDGTWSVQWFHPEGYPISSSQIEGATWYRVGEIEESVVALL